jgi:hypothetical protein
MLPLLALGLGLIMALPVLGGQAAGAEGQTGSHAGVPQAPALADRLFRVESSAGAVGQGQFQIVGYVYNDYGEDAVNVELRISELDPSGRTIATIDRPVGDTVPAGGRIFFDARVAGTSPSYRVAVSSFDFMADGQWKTLTTEQVLAAVGFQKKIADTPEKLTHLRTLTPARRLVAHRQNDRLYYVYADPAMCKCLYVGTPEQYQRAIEQRLANEQLVAQQEHLNDDAVIWPLWAPWPWF